MTVVAGAAVVLIKVVGRAEVVVGAAVVRVVLNSVVIIDVVFVVA